MLDNLCLNGVVDNDCEDDDSYDEDEESDDDDSYDEDEESEMREKLKNEFILILLEIAYQYVEPKHTSFMSDTNQ